MYKAFGPYEYSQSRPFIQSSENKSPLYLDYNEYYGEVHAETISIYHEAKSLLTSYFRPGDHSLEDQLASVYGIAGSDFFLVSGADHALEEILGYFKNQMNLEKFSSYYPTTYDHFYTFTEKLGLEQTSFEMADIVYVCCPNNPDGKIISPDECAQLASLYSEKYFMLDMSYLTYTHYTYQSYLSVLKNYPNVFFLSSLAKIYPIAGLRAGWFSTNSPEAIRYFRKFLNSKMVNPVSRKILQTCLENHHFYKEQTHEIFVNRRELSDLLISFFQMKGVKTEVKYEIAVTGGNFFSLQFQDRDTIQEAIKLLEEANIFIRFKAHWDFIRVTSVNNLWLAEIKERLQ